jgi:hypothetical protein
MGVKLLRFPHKRIRAQIIKQYMQDAGYKKAVCFSCGNAGKALADAGVNVLHIGAQGELTPNKWYTQADIAQVFTGYFDATSGHLPMQVMLQLADAYKEHLSNTLGSTVYVPTGSGETLVCLKLAYPDKRFIAVYNLDSATEYSKDAPLNRLVQLLADGIIYNEQTATDTGNKQGGNSPA